MTTTNLNSLFVLVYTEGHYKNQCATVNDLNLPGEPGVAFFGDRSAAHTAMGAREDFHAMTLGAFFALSAGMATDLTSTSKQFNTLRNTVTTFLEDGVSGSLDPDEFMAETEALAEAVGFEFTEEKTYIVEVAVMVKQKRGADISAYAFTAEMYVNDDDVEITGVDINSVDEE